MKFHTVIERSGGWDTFPRPLERHSLVPSEGAQQLPAVRKPTLRAGDDPHLSLPRPHHVPAHSTATSSRGLPASPNFPLPLAAFPTATKWWEVLVTLQCHFCGVVSPAVNQNAPIRVGVRNDLMTYKNDHVFLKPVGRGFILRRSQQTIKEGEQNTGLLVTTILSVLISPTFTSDVSEAI